MSGPHFRDYHLLLDDQADQVFAMTDEVAERARKLTSKPELGFYADRGRTSIACESPSPAAFTRVL
jgi:DNA-binding ferritin-like protein